VGELRAEGEPGATYIEEITVLTIDDRYTATLVQPQVTQSVGLVSGAFHTQHSRLAAALAGRQGTCRAVP
jgi:hypothetical protein